MDRIQKINYPSFYKIMLGDFSTRLGVPQAFENNFEKLDLSRDFTVSLKFVVEEGISWKVKLEKGSNGLYEFTRGWSKIVKDLHLALGDFLVFYLVEDYAFQLSVYDPSSRLKTLNINPRPTTFEGSSSVANEKNAEVKITEKEVIKSKKKSRSRKKKSQSHSVVYTEPASRRPYCILPEWFGKEIHKECNEDGDVMIKDDKGREWVMKLKLRVQPTYRRYELITGWLDFCKGINVAVGDKFNFNHIQGSTIGVHVHHI